MGPPFSDRAKSRRAYTITRRATMFERTAKWNVWYGTDGFRRGQKYGGRSKLTEDALSVRIANVYNLLVRWQVAAVTDID